MVEFTGLFWSLPFSVLGQRQKKDEKRKRERDMKGQREDK